MPPASGRSSASTFKKNCSYFDCLIRYFFRAGKKTGEHLSILMLIYNNYDQEHLDRQYNNRLNVPDFATYLDRWEVLSQETEQMFTRIKDLQYGELRRERLDVYPSSFPNATTLVFIHGGYWHLFDKASFQFIA